LRLVIAITGASGSLYAQRLLDNLDARAHEVHVVLSNYAACGCRRARCSTASRA
jgi:flavin prenyltransferase